MSHLRIYRPPAEYADAFPRFHIRAMGLDCSFPVDDRVLSVRYWIRLAKDRWFVRSEDGTESRPFANLESAVAAIRDGTWDLMPGDADRRPIRRHSRREDRRCPTAAASTAARDSTPSNPA